MTPARKTLALVAGGTVLVLGLGSTSGVVAAGLVTSKDIKDGTIKLRDINDRAQRRLAGAGGETGPTGPTGETGPAGPAGPQGERGARGSTGSPGAAGADGAPGEQGVPGEQGPAGPQGPAGTPAETVVTALGGQFRATGSGVGLTPDGVAFGPYADGSGAGGALQLPAGGIVHLRDLRNLALDARYLSSGDTAGAGAPWVRVYVQNPDGRGDDHSFVFRPVAQPDADAAEGAFHEWVPTSGHWQYDDNSGSLGAPVAWSTLLSRSEDAGREVRGLAVGVGRTQGSNLSGLLRWCQINGVTYAFRG